MLPTVSPIDFVAEKFQTKLYCKLVTYITENMIYAYAWRHFPRFVLGIVTLQIKIEQMFFEYFTMIYFSIENTRTQLILGNHFKFTSVMFEIF